MISRDLMLVDVDMLLLATQVMMHTYQVHVEQVVPLVTIIPPT
jgi:hypothetical protein